MQLKKVVLISTLSKRWAMGSLKWCYFFYTVDIQCKCLFYNGRTNRLNLRHHCSASSTWLVNGTMSPIFSITLRSQKNIQWNSDFSNPQPFFESSGNSNQIWFPLEFISFNAAFHFSNSRFLEPIFVSFGGSGNRDSTGSYINGNGPVLLAMQRAFSKRSAFSV